MGAGERYESADARAGPRSMYLMPGLHLVLFSAVVTQGTASTVIRVNQLGYRPDAPKVAVVCSLRDTTLARFSVVDAESRTVLTRPAAPAPPFAACIRTWRLDFSSIRAPGTYRIVSGAVTSRPFRIATDVYDGAADTLLYYMRQQRSGYNPLFRTVVHQRDGIVVDDSARAGRFVPVTGGWADASDYLQYVTTSANATVVMLMAHRDHPGAFADAFDARGDSGSNGVADVLDEARHGLEWLVRMFPSDTEMYNQLGDDRDHSFLDLPPTDSSDYGWGKGRERPLYPCTGRPQGLLQHRNRSDGHASTAGKYAAALALGAVTWRARDTVFAATLEQKARAAYTVGKRSPGVCQTAPAGAPYFYEEDNWADDMELGATQLF